MFTWPRGPCKDGLCRSYIGTFGLQSYSQELQSSYKDFSPQFRRRSDSAFSE